MLLLLAGDLMFHLNRMLSSPRLESIVTWEVALFVVIKFLFRQELATNLCFGEVSQSQRRPLLGPSPG